VQTLDALTIILIAFGLAIDAFAVSIANGMNKTINRRRAALLTAGFFGGFQMLMPVLGWLVGLSLESVIKEVDKLALPKLRYRNYIYRFHLSV